MKPLFLLSLILPLLFSSTSFAQSIPQGIPMRTFQKSLFLKKAEKRELTTPPPVQQKKKPRPAPTAKKNSPPLPTPIQKANPPHSPEPLLTNLPSAYLKKDRSQIKSNDTVVYSPKLQPTYLSGIKPGDLIQAVIEEKIKASSSVPSPIRAMALTGPYPGAFFLGEATLDPELKRVLLHFHKLRLPKKDQIYQLKASGRSPTGEIGLEGEYSSQAGLFFAGEVLSATSAGLLDSTITRNQTAMGGYVQDPSLTNSLKAGVVSGMAKTSERMAEKMRTAPEYTVTEGYQEIQVIIQESPIEIEG